jgi:hypothetical protein
VVDLSELRPAGESIAKAFEKMSASAFDVADRIAELASALREFQPEVPEVGDYVRITEELDQDYGQIGEVQWVDSIPYRDVHVMLHPFGGGVKTRRPFDLRSITIMSELEVIAEAAR